MKKLIKLCENQSLCGLIPGIRRAEVRDLLGEPEDFMVNGKRKTAERSTVWHYGEDFQVYFDYGNIVTHINSTLAKLLGVRIQESGFRSLTNIKFTT